MMTSRKFDDTDDDAYDDDTHFVSLHVYNGTTVVCHAITTLCSVCITANHGCAMYVHGVTYIIMILQCLCHGFAMAFPWQSHALPYCDNV